MKKFSSKEIIKEINQNKTIQFKVGDQFRMKPKFKINLTLLMENYDYSSLMTAIANSNLNLFNQFIEPQIKKIKRQRKVSNNKIDANKFIEELLKTRDKELNLLNSEIFKLLFSHKKPKTKNKDLEDRILNVLQKNDTVVTLAEKLNITDEYLRRELTKDRIGKGIKQLKESKIYRENYLNEEFLMTYNPL